MMWKTLIDNDNNDYNNNNNNLGRGEGRETLKQKLSPF